MNHKVTTEELRAWSNEEKFIKYASSYGMGQNKELGVDNYGNFVVKKKGKIIMRTGNAATATDKYNSI